MGWSQGGYISAFLTTSTTKCAAVSVGAGISNWATYYYNTDITPFTIQYLGDDPADDPEIYRKTSPMTYIKQAKTPTLIQHGENDRRVPIANALRAAAGARGSRRAGRDGRLQGIRPRHHQAEGDARRDAAQPRVVQSPSLGRPPARSDHPGRAEDGRNEAVRRRVKSSPWRLQWIGSFACAAWPAPYILLTGSAAIAQDPAAGLPPLLDRELFFGNPEISGAQLSPDGQFLAFIKPFKDTRNVWVKKLSEPFAAAKLVTNDPKRPIPGYFWSRDSKYILFVQDQAGDENYNVYAVNPGRSAGRGTEVPARAQPDRRRRAFARSSMRVPEERARRRSSSA